MYKILIYFLVCFNTFINLFALTKSEFNYYINTENITFEEDKEKLIFGSNSIINFKDKSLMIDKGFIDYKKNLINVEGDFYYYDGDIILNGLNLKSDTNLNSLKASEVSLIYRDDLKIDSNLLNKNIEYLVLNNNFLTPCEINGYFNCPSWSFKIQKTKYILEEDKFIHYNSFFQILDKKVFYIPYFTHYGRKAPRKNGFLTPTFVYRFGDRSSFVKIPYYIPIKSNSELTLTSDLPIMSMDTYLDDLHFQTKFSSVRSSGELNLDINTNFKNNFSDFYNSIKINSKQVINKKNNYDLKLLLTNSISSSRSFNEDGTTYEEGYIKINSFNFFNKNDLLVSEFNTVTSFEDSNTSLIPYQLPHLRYFNTYQINKTGTIENNIEIINLIRDHTDGELPSNNFKLSSKNVYIDKYNLYKFETINRFIINLNANNLSGIENQPNEEIFSSINISTEPNLKSYHDLKPRVKLIVNSELNKNLIYNEDSNSINFNYYNLFNENRFLGQDLSDNSKRVVYGIELVKQIFNSNLEINVGQSYDLYTNNEYLSKINQENNFSDIALYNKFNFENITIKNELRIDNNSLSKKELNYSINYEGDTNIGLIYDEATAGSYLENSSDSKTLKLNLSRDLNKNMKISGFTNLDLKNNYYPFKNQISLNIFDECTDLSLIYSNTKFNDNAETKPSETITISLSLDYLGFFSVAQKNNLITN